MEINIIVEKILSSSLYGFSISDYIISKSLDIGTGLLWDKWKVYVKKSPKVRSVSSMMLLRIA